MTKISSTAHTKSSVTSSNRSSPLARLKTYITPPLIAFGLGAALCTTLAAPPLSAEESIYEQLDTFTRILQIIRKEYVDDVNDKEVIEAAIQGMLKSLDPHSTYLNQDTFQQIRVQMEGEYGGLGLEVQMENGLVKVISPIDDTPAAEAGIEGGDYISHINGESILGKSLTEAVKDMRGPVGKPVTVTIIREGMEEPFDVKIVREKILVRSVRHRVEEDTIGYLRITTFNMQAGEGVENAVRKLKAEIGPNMDGLIIDLRNNPGGLLNEAIRISDAFLDRGEIVSTRGRRRSNNNRWYATAGDMLDGLPIVILVNAYSASASEIVAGALKDHRRAIILGEKTFGKGTVQTETRLGDGDHAIRLTTARYFMPSGQSIQELGVEPDIDVILPRDPRRSIRREADLQGHIKNDQISEKRLGETDSTLTEETVSPVEAAAADQATDTGPIKDIQLEYAVKLLKDMAQPLKRTVADANLQ